MNDCTDTHIQDVLNLIQWEELTDIVLCGHSYGGCVISGVVDRMPERIRSLVYLDQVRPIWYEPSRHSG